MIGASGKLNVFVIQEGGMMALIFLDNKIIAKRNNSLTTEDGVKLLTVILLIMLLITFGFAKLGTWFVMPFAGLEFVAFCYAFYTVYLHVDDYESVTIDHEYVLVEKQNNKKLTSTLFKRYWAQVNLKQKNQANGLSAKSTLVISSHGKEVEFGNELVSEEQLVELAQTLKQKIKNIT